MPLFMCAKCHCVENTALGCFWSAEQKSIWGDQAGKPTCSECGPKQYKGGSKSPYGTWHERFPKKSAAWLYIDVNGYLWDAPQDPPKHWPVIGRVMEDFSIRPLVENCPTCKRWLNAPLFDGCMNNKCPFNFEACR